MMGVSLLSMPWALYQAGFILGLVILLTMAALCFYTAYLVVRSPHTLEKIDTEQMEFADICHHYLGRAGSLTAFVFSLLILVGAVLAYWVLMSNFVYFSGVLLYVYCHVDNTFSSHSDEDDPTLIFGLKFDEIWKLQLTVPIYLAIVVFPLLNFKSPTFFTKFNMLGTISVVYLLCFNASRVAECGINMDFTNKTSPHFVHSASWNFPALTGMLTMSYFIHNCLLTMLRNQRNPENNVRDLCIGFALVAFSYIFVAATIYSAFPLRRSCIGDNLLNNFRANYPMSAVARVLIFFQLLTILPLILYFIRSQISCAIYNKPWPGLVRVVALNLIIVVAGVLTAVFFPDIGSIIRYFGAFSGMMYTYALPCLVYMRSSYLANELTMPKIIVHSLIIVFGVANLIAQFFIR
ncbi:unnamed protein product [Nippostrongylus brasiliensis]|uniref:Putative sodium-coupled neutral amino acid transporter 9 (inferred by orthology to a human protein) n=1 Tax=Nippostrongylus brasiliensis TaxID=27835 RepID=A0A158R0P7_NIPBR|nr:unnamed protein product [Nippostrongylus brasiliensis]